MKTAVQSRMMSLGVPCRCGANASGSAKRLSSTSSSFRGGMALPSSSVGRRGVPQSRASAVVEANLFSRVTRIVKSYADAIVTAAEDPEKILEQSVQDMQEDLIKMKQTSATVIASRKQLEKKYEQAQATADDWYKRAQLALEKGDEELAREALKRKRTYQESADSFKTQLEYQVKAVETLIANTQQLENKLTEAKSKKDTLKARAQSAKASKQVNEMVGSLNTSNAVSAFEKMEEKVIGMEAESEAIGQIAGGDAIDEKFLALEGGSVEDDLAALKSKTLSGSKSPSKSLPEGRPIKDAIDMELEDLRKKARE
ncbi:hypothetical protein BSKO_03996 [Bryopsis sp. KO-2023]|nr:hypothetical protein BSKO_03996 [Bryopsis sp. KO-2023]